MSLSPYTTTPHAYHAQTFPLDPAPFLTPLTRHISAPALVLDLGCGSGRDDAFTNTSVLGTGEMWLGYVVENRLT
jgi:hypothetical protein